MNSLMAVHVTL